MLIAVSIVLSILFWRLYLWGEWGDKIVMFWVGVPSGVIAGILYLIIKKYLLATKPKALQVLSFLLLIVLVNFLYYKAGDIWFLISKG